MHNFFVKKNMSKERFIFLGILLVFTINEEMYLKEIRIRSTDTAEIHIPIPSENKSVSRKLVFSAGWQTQRYRDVRDHKRHSIVAEVDRGSSVS